MAVDFRAAEAEIVSQDFDVAQDFKANELGTVAKFRDVGSTDYGTALFKYVQYEQGAAAVDGVANEVCYYYQADGFSTHQVSSDASDSIFAATSILGAGVMHSSPSDSQYLWIQLTGPATLAQVPVVGGGSAIAPADGAALTSTGTSGDDGNLMTVNIASIATATLGLAYVCAYIDDQSDGQIICDFLH
tara:strand:+ start:276 stop:842 length:567 start_codon:yes stop_codon:yes gene_type:complete